MYDNILFDLDGTLTDSSSGIFNSINYALNKMNVMTPDADVLNRFLGPPLIDSFINYLNMSRAEAARAVEYYRERYATVGIYENSIYAGIPQLLARLSLCGKNLYLATSKPKVYADKILNHFELYKYFKETFGCGLDGTMGEKSQVIGYALAKQRIAVNNAVMVGDRKFDIIGAKANNLRSIGVLYGYGTCSELTYAGADFTADSVEHLGRLLQK